MSFFLFDNYYEHKWTFSDKTNSSYFFTDWRCWRIPLLAFCGLYQRNLCHKIGVVLDYTLGRCNGVFGWRLY